MTLKAKLCTAKDILPLRTRLRQEMNCQIVHDSLHRREGWTLNYLLESAGATAGFGSVAVAGPWKDKPTFFQFYLLPEHRARAFEFFEALLATSGAQFFEVQSNDLLTTAVALTYARDIASEKVVFQDQTTSNLSVPGAALKPMKESEKILIAVEERQGGGEWVLEFDGEPAGKGGILFHYNPPYGDIYMEVNEGFRKRGLGSYLVQELKRECYSLGAIPCARCNPTNIGSRRTLGRAGFAPVAHILIGALQARK
jgi:hypothetical protein